VAVEARVIAPLAALLTSPEAASTALIVAVPVLLSVVRPRSAVALSVPALAMEPTRSLVP
jgi:hypothetical protein